MKTKLDKNVFSKIALYSLLAGAVVGIGSNIPFFSILVNLFLCAICIFIPLAGGYAGYWAVKEHHVTKENTSDSLLIGGLAGALSGFLSGLVNSVISLVAGLLGITAFSILGANQNSALESIALVGVGGIVGVILGTFMITIVFGIAGLIGGLLANSQNEDTK